MFANIFKKKKAKRSEVKMETDNKEKEEIIDDVNTEKEATTEKAEEIVTPIENDETAEQTEDTSTSVVEEVEPVGNGMDINDLVTKDMLAERLSAFESKLDALIKENQDLKDKLAEKDGELNGMKDKYENKDFGTIQKQGVMPKNKQANDTFAEYAKQFM